MGEVIYTIKKFLVTLNTTNHEQVKVGQGKKKGVAGLLNKRRSSFAHTIIRVPEDDTPVSIGLGHGGSRIKRRKHLVRGFVWGKNTRPIEEQRWVKPYWRGAQEVGVVDRSHYDVKNMRKAA